MSDTTTTGAAAEAAPALVTPDELRQRFADPDREIRNDEGRYTLHQGFCGLTMIGNRDPMVSGFDDGYDFMGYLEGRGWKALASKGDWPYVVYLVYGPREPYAIATYVEADFSLRVFDDREAAAAFLRTVPEAE